MAIKPNINFNSSFKGISYEEIDDTAWPATSHNNIKYNQAVEDKIRNFRRRKLGQAAMKLYDLHDLDQLMA